MTDLNSCCDSVDRPVFLVAAERSGTTMFRLMLDHHPQISWINEFEYSVDLINGEDVPPNLDVYRDWLSTHRIFLASGFAVCGDTYQEVVRGFLRQRAKQSAKRVIGATVHRRFRQLAALWPEARYIHLVRDPRDVARSVIGMGWAGNVWHGVRKWVEAEEELGEFLQELERERVISLRYEDLLVDPERHLRRICAFAGVEYSPQMLDYPADTSYGAPDPALAWQWRRNLSDREVRLVEARVGDMLAERGYEPSGRAPLDVSAADRRRLYWQNRLFCAWFRARRFGFTLYLSDQVARRLRIKRLQKRLALQMNEVTQRYLR